MIRRDFSVSRQEPALVEHCFLLIEHVCESPAEAKKKKIEEARKKRIADIEEKRRVLKEKKDAIKKQKEKGNNDQNNN